MTMTGRSWSQNSSYRFGFQGQEQDQEYYSGAVSYKYRIHDPRIGRFLSIDPLSPEYPWNSPYAFSENRVIDRIELEGLESTKPVQASYKPVFTKWSDQKMIDFLNRDILYYYPPVGQSIEQFELDYLEGNHLFSNLDLSSKEGIDFGATKLGETLLGGYYWAKYTEIAENGASGFGVQISVGSIEKWFGEDLNLPSDHVLTAKLNEEQAKVYDSFFGGENVPYGSITDINARKYAARVGLDANFKEKKHPDGFSAWEYMSGTGPYGNGFLSAFPFEIAEQIPLSLRSGLWGPGGDYFERPTRFNAILRKGLEYNKGTEAEEEINKFIWKIMDARDDFLERTNSNDNDSN